MKVHQKINLYIAIDTTGSMAGMRIASINNYIKTIKSILNVLPVRDIEVVLRVISFGDEIRWCLGTPEKGVHIHEIEWNDLITGGARTPIGEVLQIIAESITPNNTSPEDCIAIILITDGQTTESTEYYKYSCKIIKNKLNCRIKRVAIGIDGASKNELSQFASVGKTNNNEYVKLVLKVDNRDDLIYTLDQTIKILIANAPNKLTEELRFDDLHYVHIITLN